MVAFPKPAARQTPDAAVVAAALAADAGNIAADAANDTAMATAKTKKPTKKPAKKNAAPVTTTETPAVATPTPKAKPEAKVPAVKPATNFDDDAPAFLNRNNPENAAKLEAGRKAADDKKRNAANGVEVKPVAEPTKAELVAVADQAIAAGAPVTKVPAGKKGKIAKPTAKPAEDHTGERWDARNNKWIADGRPVAERPTPPTAKAKTPKAPKEKKIGITHQIRQVLLKDPNVNLTELKAALKKAGIVAKDATVAVVRTDCLDAVRILRDMGIKGLGLK